jgi:glycosyltransferase involved in cell wall biosynthesis
MPDNDLTLAVCTRERPAELRRLMDSIGRSQFRKLERPDVDVLIVDNTPGGSSLDAADLSARCGWPVRIVEEPRPGVAFARNTAIENRHAAAPLFLCVDDDQVVTPSWLEAHIDHAARSDAPVMTGPVLVRIPDAAPPWARALWQSGPRHPTGTSLPSFLGGNVCFRTELFDEVADRYDESQATATADDLDLGRRLRLAGHDIEWNDEAIAWEIVPEARLRLRWFVERFISFGGFEAMWTRKYRGRRALLAQAPGQLRGLCAGIAAGVASCLPNQSEAARARRQAKAIATTAMAAGWVGGVFGIRLQDYRRVTSERPGADR